MIRVEPSKAIASFRLASEEYTRGVKISIWSEGEIRNTKIILALDTERRYFRYAFRLQTWKIKIAQIIQKNN